MSFFGFDVSLPRDRPAPGGGGGSAAAAAPGGVTARSYGDEFDPTFDPTFGDGLEDEGEDPGALDAKISALTSSAQEDVAVYTWGEEDYDGLGDKLEEDLDDLNDDTFNVGDIGTDFDFGHGPKATPAAAAPAPAPAPAAPPKPKSKFESTLDDFWSTGLKKQTGIGGARASPAPQGPAGPAGRQPGKTMEEIEAEMRASRISPAAAPAGRRPLTMDELEAQMRQQRAGPPQMMPPPPASGPPQLPPPGLANIMAQQQQQQQAPPMPMPMPQQRPMQPPPPQMMPRGPFPPGMLPPGGGGAMPPAAMQMQAAARMQAEAEAAHFARMKALLDSMPDSVQKAILSLPAPLQFDALENVVEAHPHLRNVRSIDLAAHKDVIPAVEALEKAAVDHVFSTAKPKIEELQRHEARVARRMAKIQGMAKYNGLMTRSDQDFITRIQVSQLVTQDPYTDDFYAHIYLALRGGRGPSAPVLGESTSDKKNGRKQPRLSRRENAMLRMQQQVERIVKNRIERSAKSTNGVALEGALGKVTTSSTKGMRQVLSLGSAAAENGARDALRAALAGVSLDGNPGEKRPALPKREVLRILETLYDTVLAIEQLRRSATPDAAEAEALVWKLWQELRVLEPLDISDPHPFVALISTVKGKRLLPRVLRHLSPEQTLTTMTMIVASFDALDVVRNAHLLDGETAGATDEQREDAERQTEAFANAIVPGMMTLIAGAPMKIVSGMLAVFIERNDAVRVAKSRPGLAFLTIFLSRAESLRQTNAVAKDDLEQWTQIFSLLFQRLSAPGMLPSLFPSTRAKAQLPFGPGYYLSGAFGAASLADAAKSIKHYRNIDIEDEPVWNFMAALAVTSTMEQQQTLVAELREKILENVMSAKEWQKRKSAGALPDPISVGTIRGQELGPEVRIRNVNLLLHALNLDATQIAI